MIVDKDGKLFGKINIIDAFTIIIAIIVVFGIALRFCSAPSKNATEYIKLKYVVEIHNVRKYTVDALSKKGIVINPDQRDEVGEILDVSYSPEIWEEFDSDGNVIFVEVPNKYTVKVTVLSTGRENDNKYYVGKDTELSVGSIINLATKYSNSSGTVKSIKKL